MVVSGIGMFIAGALSYAKYANMVVPCGGSRNCEIVQNSVYSKLAGLPVAYYGLVGYILLFALAWARCATTGKTHTRLSIVGLVGAGAGLAFSAFLTYKSITELQMTCVWCMASLVTILVLTLMHGALLQGEPSETSDLKTGNVFGGAVAVLSLGAVVVQGMNLEKTINDMVGQIVADNVSVEEILPSESKIKGSKDAKVVIVEFADVNCPSCRAAFKEVEHALAPYGDKIRFAFCHYPAPDKQGHETSVNAALISEVAAEKGMFWKCIATIMDEKNTERIRTIEGLLAVAEESGLTKEEIVENLSPTTQMGKVHYEKLLRAVADDMDAGKRLQVSSTPTYIVFTPDQPVKAVSYKGLQSLIKEPWMQALLTEK